MPDRMTIIGLGASVAALLFVLELVRRRKLREDYSLLWLATAIVLIILSGSRPLLDKLAIHGGEDPAFPCAQAGIGFCGLSHTHRRWRRPIVVWHLAQ